MGGRDPKRTRTSCQASSEPTAYAAPRPLQFCRVKQVRGRPGVNRRGRTLPSDRRSSANAKGWEKLPDIFADKLRKPQDPDAYIAWGRFSEERRMGTRA